MKYSAVTRQVERIAWRWLKDSDRAQLKVADLDDGDVKELASDIVFSLYGSVEGIEPDGGRNADND